MSRTFSTKNGLLDSLNDLLRCGCTPNKAKYRCTLLFDTPVAAAIPRTLQCVAASGRSVSAFFTSPATRSSSWVRARPAFGRSWSPANPSILKRFRQ